MPLTFTHAALANYMPIAATATGVRSVAASSTCVLRKCLDALCAVLMRFVVLYGP